MTDSPERPKSNDWPMPDSSDTSEKNEQAGSPEAGSAETTPRIESVQTDSASAEHIPASGEADAESQGDTKAAPAAAEEDTQPAPQPVPVPKGLLDHCFDALSYLPMLTLFAIVALQTWFTLDSRALWFSDEIRYANVFEHVINAKKWIVLYLNGIPYPDKPPVYFWLLKALYPFVGEASPKLFMLGAAVSGLLFTWVTYLFARALGEDKKTAFAAGLILLSTFFTVGMMHYSRMDLLFATLITLSHLCLFKGWQKESAFGWIVLGFFFAGIATLTKGPLGLAFPIISIILFTIWRFRFKRLLGWDVAIGFGVMTAVCLTWVSAAYFTEDPDYLRNIFQQQIIKRATDTWHHGQPWWFYFATLSGVMVPWTFLLITVPWERLFGVQFYKNLWATRQPERMGLAYVWISLLSGFGLLSAISIKLPVYLMPLFPLLAILSARGLMRLTPGRCRMMFRLFALLFAGVAGGLVYLEFFNNPFHVQLAGWDYLAAIAGVCAATLWIAAPRRGEGGLLLLAACVTAFILPLGTITAPSLDAIMSPKAQATIMRSYLLNGFAPASYRIYSGTYSYYAKSNIFETNDWAELDTFVQEHPDVVVAIRQKHWEEWPNKPEGMQIVHRQMLVDPKPSNEYLLAIRRSTPELAAPPDME
ncbi:glycosyltransferase family 39 protein [Desulfovibrio mangrovi]|uniref:ArnT family glycosyltransferase n=1 Tax=Desulfovibrio mangrovi TaxID=2976983 RepID=UPI002245F201|nr:glycosyltransferase family 39 protein [Desulfovibrio mangrovi]UZP68013.1 glycosyltransferase family 39 protein [Desulfovibrio mangrovi]